jgi:hypothetical protein
MSRQIEAEIIDITVSETPSTVAVVPIGSMTTTAAFVPMATPTAIPTESLDLADPVVLTYKERVIEEKKQLDEKLAKLSAFFGTPKYDTDVNNQEKNRLRRQAEVMKEYSDILAVRIASF